MRYFSMFSGIGGFELGIERAYNNQSAYISKESESEERKERRQRDSEKPGALLRSGIDSALCIGFSEINKYAIQCYSTHFPDHKNYGSATDINPEKLPDFDMLCGGFPCQAFSIAGQRLGFQDTRGTLFFEIARIVKVKRPKILFLENVKGLLNHDKGRTFAVILATLDELGYNAEWEVLNSKYFGVPQNRERVFIIGHLRGQCGQQVFPIGQTADESYEGYAEAEIAASLQSPGHASGNYKGMNMVLPVLTPDRLEKRQNGRRFKEEGKEMFTLTGQDKHGIMKEGKIRRLTPRECERLQGFPDDWTAMLSDTQRYKTLGNAVTVNVIESISKKLLEVLK